MAMCVRGKWEERGNVDGLPGAGVDVEDLREPAREAEVDTTAVVDVREIKLNSLGPGPTFRVGTVNGKTTQCPSSIFPESPSRCDTCP